VLEYIGIIESPKSQISMQTSRLFISIVVVCVVAAGIGGYAVYENSTKKAVMAQQEQLGEVSTSTPTAQNTTDPNQSSNQTTILGVRNNNDDEDDSNDDDDDVPANSAKHNTPQTTAPAPSPADTAKKTTKYKDGTYTATGSYDSPGGPDRLGVSITIKNDVVTSTSATNMAGDRTSSRYQKMFISGYQALVIGKNIDSINLDIVSGSSLTPQGFNDALSKIKVQAKA